MSSGAPSCPLSSRRGRATALVAASLLGASPALAVAPARIGGEAYVAPVETQTYARHLGFRPADGALVTLNPPRLSWPYEANQIASDADFTADNRFTLQIAASVDFASPAVDVRDTPYNFYNFLPRLEGAEEWFWRVGYNVGTAGEQWSATRSFRLAPDAIAWDRSGFQALLDAAQAHPRILLNRSTRRDLLRLSQSTDPYVRDMYAQVLAKADQALARSWYASFPADDCPEYPAGGSKMSCQLDYKGVAEGLTFVELAYLLTDDARYAGYRERFLTLASFGPGGLSSPEGLNPLGQGETKWPTHVTEHLGMFYDWNAAQLTAAERATVRASLEWRIDHIVHNYSWQLLRGSRRVIPFNSIARIGWSHQYQGLFPTVLGALAIFDESAVAYEALELGLHYIVGVTSSYGPDEGWNEGPGYGNDKFGYLVDAVVALDTVFPELELEKLETLRRHVDFFSRITPVGAEHSSFGNRSYNESDFTASRFSNFRRLGMLLSDGQAAQNWYATMGRRERIGKGATYDSLWSNYLYAAISPEPVATREADPVAAFLEAGWVAASSAAPSDDAAQEEAVAIVFQARPRGAYGHSFASDNAFDLHAYGHTLAVGGGSTANTLTFPRTSLSHNTVLVNGDGQLYSAVEDYSRHSTRGAASDLAAPIRARVSAFSRGTSPAGPYVYFAGDAAAAYAAQTGLARFLRHVVFVDNSYFVIYDDLAMKAGGAATYQWLYHVVPGSSVPLSFDAAAFAFDYTLGDVNVRVQHVAGTDDLSFDALLGQDGQVNIVKCGYDPTPGTCAEDYRFEQGDADHDPVIDAHHVWVRTRTARPAGRFLAVVVPYRAGEAQPEIEVSPLSDRAVTVDFRGRRSTVSFDPAVDADINVDPEAIAQAGFAAPGAPFPGGSEANAWSLTTPQTGGAAARRSGLTHDRRGTVMVAPARTRAANGR